MIDFDPRAIRIPSEWEIEAVEAGARANREGHSIWANPYDEDTPLWLAWRAGYRRPGMYIG